jgi:hypothetical protein
MGLLPSGRAALALLLAAAGPAAGQASHRFTYPEHGFSIAMPAEWRAIAPRSIELYDSATPPPPGVRDVAGFRALAGYSEFAPPYLMVRKQTSAGLDRPGLQRLADDPRRRIRVQQWLLGLEKSYGTRYDPALFGWEARDGILWMVGSERIEPYPEVIIVTGAVAFRDEILLVVYQIFPSMDLGAARNTVRSALRSIRAEE